MAALSISHSFHSKTSIQQKQTKKCQTVLISMSFHSQESMNNDTSRQARKDEKKEKKSFLTEIYVGIEKIGKELKDNLNPQPKQKGDWKDLMLMSLSFAVYVYISQKIVCAYFAWIYMTKHNW